MNISFNKVKVVVSVPKKNLEQLRDAIFNEGVGIIGNYSHCSMSYPITGTFMPNNFAEPYTGKKSKMTFVQEERLEVSCNIDKIKDIILIIRENHPYQEPAIEIIPLFSENDFINNLELKKV